MVYLSDAGLPMLFWKKGRETDVVVVVVSEQDNKTQNTMTLIVALPRQTNIKRQTVMKTRYNIRLQHQDTGY